METSNFGSGFLNTAADKNSNDEEDNAIEGLEDLLKDMEVGEKITEEGEEVPQGNGDDILEDLLKDVEVGEEITEEGEEVVPQDVPQENGDDISEGIGDFLDVVERKK